MGNLLVLIYGVTTIIPAAIFIGGAIKDLNFWVRPASDSSKPQEVSGWFKLATLSYAVSVLSYGSLVLYRGL